MKEKIKRIVAKILCIIVISITCFCAISVMKPKTSFADSGHDTSHSRSKSSKSKSHRSSSKSRRSSKSNSSSSKTIKGKPPQTSSMAVVLAVSFTVGSIFIFAYVMRACSKRKYKNITAKQEIISSSTQNKIKNIVPDFNEREFLNEGFCIYKDIQEAWMNFDLDRARNILTDEMFNMYQSQLATMEIKDEQNIMRDMVMKNGYILDAIYQNEVLTIVTQYVIEQYDYVVDRRTGKTIRGEDKRKMRVEYQMRFRLNVNNMSIIKKCPNCGADWSNHNGSGTCEYCGSKVVSDSKKWVLTDKKAINQMYI